MFQSQYHPSTQQLSFYDCLFKRQIGAQDIEKCHLLNQRAKLCQSKSQITATHDIISDTAVNYVGFSGKSNLLDVRTKCSPIHVERYLKSVVVTEMIVCIRFKIKLFKSIVTLVKEACLPKFE